MNFRRYTAPLAAAGAVTVLAAGIVGAQNSGTSSNSATTTTTTAAAPGHGAFGGGLTDAYLEALAGNLGVSVDDLKADLTKTANDWIDAALKAGTITADEATTLKAEVTDGNYLGPVGRIEGEKMRADAEAARDALIKSVADYLGITSDELQTRVQDGASLAAIAETEGKDLAGLKTLIEDSLGAKIDAAVDDGRIDEATATDLKNMLPDRVDSIVNGEGWFGFGIGMGDGFDGHRGPGFGGRGHHGFGGGGFGAPDSGTGDGGSDSSPDAGFSGF